MVQSPCALSRGMESSSRAMRSGVWSPVARNAAARPSVSSFQTKIHAPRVAPEPVEQVVLAGLLVEHVDHDLHVVEQHPAPSLQPLDVPGPQALLAQGLLDVLRHRLHLHVARGRAQQEIVAHRVEAAQVEGHEVMRLLGQRGARRGLQQAG